MHPSACRVTSLVLVLLAMSSLMPLVRGYVYIMPNTKSTELEGHCYDRDLKIAVPVNEVRQRPGRCESMRCDSEFSLDVVGCGVVAGGPGVIITKTDYTKDYPECCPQVVMTSENLV